MRQARVITFVSHSRSRRLLSAMVAPGASVDEGRWGDACQDAVGDNSGSCYPTWWRPVGRLVPLEAVVAQLHWEVSRLRYELAVTQAQVTFLTAMLPRHPSLPVPSAPATRRPPSGDLRRANGHERAMAAMAVQKCPDKTFPPHRREEELGRDAVRRDQACDFGQQRWRQDRSHLDLSRVALGAGDARLAPGAGSTHCWWACPFSWRSRPCSEAT